MASAPHHRPDGRFRNPWPEASLDESKRRSIWKLAWKWTFGRHPPDPAPGTLPIATPDLAFPHSRPGEVRITWVGHATFLIQLPGLNLLTDPVWSRRASPFPFAGPRRFVDAIPELDELPPIDAVLLSHDHYDHLDRASVRKLADRFGGELLWFTPIGYSRWFANQGVSNVVELDWWQSAELPSKSYRVTAVPGRHWTRRRPGGDNSRLWCGWVVTPSSHETHPEPDTISSSGTSTETTDGFRIFFAGDSGACTVFSEIGQELGPFDVSLIPIGAYEPRWFMAPVHMNPEEAVQTYREMGGHGAFVGMHWGTWRLTFEDPCEPPERTRQAWIRAGLKSADLLLPQHGQTLRLTRGSD